MGSDCELKSGTADRLRYPLIEQPVEMQRLGARRVVASDRQRVEQGDIALAAQLRSDPAIDLHLIPQALRDAIRGIDPGLRPKQDADRRLGTGSPDERTQGATHEPLIAWPDGNIVAS